MMLISPFRKSFNRKSFDCGNPDLNQYLYTQLSQEIRRNICAGFILHEEGSNEIIGYYTLSSNSVYVGNIPEQLSKGLPRYPYILATLIGRLAISKNYQGKGIGELLLIDALKRSWMNKNIIGSWALVVDAIDESAERFYQHFGFQSIRNESKKLFISMNEIGKLF